MGEERPFHVTVGVEKQRQGSVLFSHSCSQNARWNNLRQERFLFAYGFRDVYHSWKGIAEGNNSQLTREEATKGFQEGLIMAR